MNWIKQYTSGFTLKNYQKWLNEQVKETSRLNKQQRAIFKQTKLDLNYLNYTDAQIKSKKLTKTIPPQLK